MHVNITYLFFFPSPSSGSCNTTGHETAEDLCLCVLFDTANDSTISIKLFLTDNSFQKYEFIAEVFLSEQRAWPNETCALHFVPLSDSSLCLSIAGELNI